MLDSTVWAHTRSQPTPRQRLMCMQRVQTATRNTCCCSRFTAAAAAGTTLAMQPSHSLASCLVDGLDLCKQHPAHTQSECLHARTGTLARWGAATAAPAWRASCQCLMAVSRCCYRDPLSVCLHRAIWRAIECLQAFLLAAADLGLLLCCTHLLAQLGEVGRQDRGRHNDLCLGGPACN